MAHYVVRGCLRCPLSGFHLEYNEFDTCQHPLSHVHNRLEDKAIRDSDTYAPDCCPLKKENLLISFVK